MITNLDHGKVWEDCLEYLSHRVKKQSFATWLRQTSGASDGNGGIQIRVPNTFVAEWIKEHYSELIHDALIQSCGQSIPFQFEVRDNPKPQTEIDFPSVIMPEETVRPVSHSPSVDGMLNDRYTFDNLVVGNFNRFPYAAAKAVAEAPGLTKYNPLYIYGGVGLGKTHLLQAIGHHIATTEPGKRIMYATSEKFTSDFISSISSDTTYDFVNMYRNVDALLIDDAQFFAGKESTQEQFFHTFNALYNAGKQIVLSSDRPPREIKGLEERLLSRFSWGLITDIQPPDMETRMAILQRKIESDNIQLEDDVISYIANSVTSNIRELEGSLIRLLAYASLRNETITLDVAKRVLSDTFGSRSRTITIQNIKRHVSDSFSVEIDMLSAKKKTQNIALARQVAMYLTRQLTKNSLKSIGDAFGGRDHSTVIHACNLVQKMVEKDVEFGKRISDITRQISA